MKKWLVIGTAIILLWVAAGASLYYKTGRESPPPDVVKSLTAVPGASQVVYAAWSPDGSRILYCGYGVWTTRPDGTEQVQLSDGYSASWRPDGSLVAFVSENGSLAVARPDGTGRVLLARDTTMGSPAWCPDGSLLAFESDNGSLEVVAPDGTGRRVLIDPIAILGKPAEGGSISVVSPVWSPDGSKMALALCSCTPDSFDPYVQAGGPMTCLQKVWVVDRDGSHARPLTEDSTSESNPSWSPDGRTISFYSSDGEGEPSRWIWKLDGNGQPEPAPAEEAGVASPDGTRIAFLYDDDDLWLKDADGGNATEVAGGSGSYYSSAWSPDGTLLVYEHTVLGPVGNIWIVKADGTGKVRLTGATRDTFDCTPEWYQYREPKWSPDGTRLLFVNALSTGNSTSMDRLWVLELDLDELGES